MLLVDIHNRAAKLHIEVEKRRLVYLIETKMDKDGVAGELLKSMFVPQAGDFIVSIDERSIVLIKELDEKDTQYTLLQNQFVQVKSELENKKKLINDATSHVTMLNEKLSKKDQEIKDLQNKLKNNKPQQQKQQQIQREEEENEESEEGEEGEDEEGEEEEDEEEEEINDNQKEELTPEQEIKQLKVEKQKIVSQIQDLKNNNANLNKQIQQIQYQHQQEKNQFILTLRNAFEQLLNEVQLTNKSKEFITFIMQLLCYSNEEIGSMFVMLSKKKEF
jgi:chromosome segregation ATPase